MSESTIRRVTFLLTDVEGSTALWERQPEAMRDALARHDAIVEAAVLAAGGRVIKARGEGDSQFAVFDAPAGSAAAVAAALAVQRALRAEAWPLGVEIRVRIAIHGGEAVARDGDFYGPTVNRCARLRAIAHGGQTILSITAAEEARSGLSGGASLEDLGLHRLKDLERPERVFELRHPDIPAGFPPLRSFDARRHNLPVQSTRFIGRAHEVEEVKRLLGVARLVTLTGAGGCGKTRLALQVAADVAEEYPDGVRLAELASVTDEGRVPQAVATALGLKEAPGRTFVETIEDALRGSRTLLVLDNCEHLVAAVASLTAGLLPSCPGLSVLATSREALGVPGESSMHVLSLPVPDEAGASFDALAASDAVRLFADRAASYRPGFALTRENAPAVAEICRRLDGIPLALELAAARVPVLSPEQIAARLGDRFRLLTGGSRTALPRQQTLRGAFDWSHDLLSPAEKALFRRLSVFVGGFTLEAAEAVGAGAPVERGAVLDVLSLIVAKSLATADPEAAEPRYGMLETAREYAGERLAESGESEAVRDLHRDGFFAKAEAGGRLPPGAAQEVWIAAMDRDVENLRVALDRGLADPACAERALNAACALHEFWEARGKISEGRAWIERGLAAAPSAPERSLAEAWSRSGTLSTSLGDFPAAERRLRAAAEAHRRLGLEGERARDLQALGVAMREKDDYAAARALHEESLAAFRRAGDEIGISAAINSLGGIAIREGDLDRAEALLGEALALRRRVGDARGTARTLNNLAVVATRRGDHTRSATLLEECCQAFRRLSDAPHAAYTLQNLGYVSLRLGDKAGALRRFAEALSIYLDYGQRVGVVECVEGLALAASAVGDHVRAARWIAAADANRAAIGHARLAEDNPTIESLRVAARRALGDEAFARAEAEGRSLPLDAVHP